MMKLYVSTNDEGMFHCSVYEDGHCVDSFEVDSIEMSLDPVEDDDEYDEDEDEDS